MIVKRVVSVFRDTGVTGVLRAVVRRIRTPRARCFSACREIVQDAVGLEIGGPSPIFSRGGLIPLYPCAERVDNVNFAHRTIWEGAIQEGDSFTFRSGRSPGKQFVAEGADLRIIPGESYDFMLSSHMLEHSANTLRALAEWGRVLKPGGGLVLVLPHRDGTFDHRRPITTLPHLIEDLDRGVGEDDLTHVPEILQLHDASKDPAVHDIPFEERAARNAEFRSLHHHVFDTRLAVAAVNQAGLEIVAVENLRPYHIVVLARKPSETGVASPFPESALRDALRKSPFPTDRQNP